MALVGAPAGWKIDGLPKDVRISRDGTGMVADVVMAFFSDLATLQQALPRLVRTIMPDGTLWLAWPRRAAGHQSDITDNKIRAAVLSLGLVDVKVAALDDDWCERSSNLTARDHRKRQRVGRWSVCLRALGPGQWFVFLGGAPPALGVT